MFGVGEGSGDDGEEGSAIKLVISTVSVGSGSGSSSGFGSVRSGKPNRSAWRPKEINSIHSTG